MDTGAQDAYLFLVGLGCQPVAVCRRPRDLLHREEANMAVHHPLDVDAARATGDGLVMEHAKGALMLRYGIDSHQALAVLLSWARTTHTPVQTVAHTLVHGICEGSPQTELRQGPLMRWLESRLRLNDPCPQESLAPSTWSRAGR
jgi:hypothetical protein